MKQPVARSPPSTLRSDLVAVASQARDYVRASRAESTLAGYAASWSLFADWCAGHGLTSLPAADDTVALFVADMAQRYKPGTLNKLVSAIAFAHRAAEHEGVVAPAVVRRVDGGGVGCDTPCTAGLDTKPAADMGPTRYWPKRLNEGSAGLGGDPTGSVS